MKRFAKMTALCLTFALLAVLFCTPLQALGSPKVKHIIGTGAIGAGTGNQTTLIDFTTSDLCGFETLGNIATPSFVQSGAWGAPVLYTWLDSAEEQTGIRGTLESSSVLTGATTLSVQLLAQYTKATSYAVTLLLESTDKNGTPLSLSATALASAGSWQTVTFDISAFVAEVNPDAPITVTVLTSSDATESEQFVLWVHSLYTSTPEAFPEFLIPAASAACGFVLGFTFFYVIYRTTCNKNRSARRKEGR